MFSRIHVIAVAGSLLVVLLVIQLIRRKQLRIEYSIVWLLGSAIMILLAVWRDLIDIVAHAIGIYYAPAVLLLLTVFFGTLGFLHVSVKLSRQAEYNKKLTQEVALLRQRLELLDNSGINTSENSTEDA